MSVGFRLAYPAMDDVLLFVIEIYGPAERISFLDSMWKKIIARNDDNFQMI